MNPEIKTYINPFTDFGFKRIFGEEMNKDLLIDFLNVLIPDTHGKIVDLNYRNSERLSERKRDKKVIFDLYCQSDKGVKFIVELQKAKQTFFKDRLVYYSTFPIREQGVLGEWNYKLEPVYTVAILDFKLDKTSELLKQIQLMDIKRKKIFYDKLTFVILEAPKFSKSIDELETKFDMWLFLLNNLSILERIPEKLRDKIFDKVFLTAEIANMSEEEFIIYEESLKEYRDMQNSLETALDEGMEIGRQEGIAIGREEGIALGKEEGIALGKEEGIALGKEEGIAIGEAKKLYELALNLKSLGVESAIIASATGLSLDEINKLK